MEYVEVIAAVPRERAEQASDLLRELADGGSWIETPFTQPDLESDAVPRDDAGARVHVYLRGTDAAANASLARMALQAAGIAAAIEVRGVAEEDWAEAWKEHFHVERFGERIVVVPSWRQHDSAPNDLVIRLDPGMAFGTGQHETTRMCLEALERAVRPGARVLDAGCGSGILSLAAAGLGAPEVLALDIDENCVRVTRENAAANALDGVVRAERGSLGDAWPEAAGAPGVFDVIVANIIARVIVELAPHFARALAPGGRVIVSGVIEEREREVVDALEAAGLRIETRRAMGDWRCIEAVQA
jgi:ribosomal protein L11 methyltransferase